MISDLDSEDYQSKREKLLAQKREYWQNHREQILAKKKEYYQKNREQTLEWQKEYRQKNRERLLAQGKKYYQKNREQLLAKHRACIDDVSVYDCYAQNWYLDDNTVTGGLEMELGGEAEAGDVYIEDPDCVIWISDVPAETDVTFTGAWTLWAHRVQASYDDREFSASIGVFTPPNSYSWPITGTGFEMDDNFRDFTIGTSTSVVEVPEDSYLAFRICKTYEGSGTWWFYVDTSGSDGSYLQSPCSDPGYPYPELSTFLLMSVGLLALVGYVGYRKRSCQ